ncbi:MAG: tetratricopeptide repeat protein [Mariniblastus sp.]|jgi:tetratricopeptide (TPR) repeat protein|nr:tetratricopeptide repeat protein [Mariniblastus sp.]
MRIGRLFQTALGLMAMSVMFVGVTDSASANDQHAEKVKASFLAHISSLASVPEPQRAAIKKTVSEMDSDFSDALTESLILMYPQYADAIAASDVSGSFQQAIELLAPLQQSKDKYLAGDASFYLARTLMNEERFEDAMPCLEKLVGDLSGFTVHQGSAQYYLGVAQAGLLKNQEAVESLMRFLQFNPNAPERLRVSAWRQVQQIQSIQKGKLDDVYQRMDYSRRRLELVETDEVTQDEQDKIVSMLTKLIKEEEKKECSSNCKKGGT